MMSPLSPVTREGGGYLHWWHASDKGGGGGGENSQFCADIIFEWPLINVTEHPHRMMKIDDIDEMEIVMEVEDGGERGWYN